MTLVHNDGKTEIHDFTLGAAVVTATEWVSSIDMVQAVVSADTLVAGDIVQLRGHGGPPDTVPAAADIGYQLGVDITADGVLLHEAMPSFVKLIKSANVGGGATNAEILMRKTS